MLTLPPPLCTEIVSLDAGLVGTLALTGFVLLIGFLALAVAGGDDDAATLALDA